MGRHKLIENEQLLAIAREVFVEKGIGASTREIAGRAGVSEAVIFQRYSTKADLFFSAMALPALDVEALFTLEADDMGMCARLEQIALGLVEYFRSLMPILLPLVTHPSFDYERFLEQHPDSPINRLQNKMMEYLEAQREFGRINTEHVGPVVLTLVAILHSFALFELMGVHGGRFSDDDVRSIVRSIWWGLAPDVDRRARDDQSE